jgi:hypothetical protein
MEPQMSRMHELVDIAFHQWEYAELKARGMNAPLACSSDIACALPRFAQKPKPKKTVYSRLRARR